MDTEIQPDEDAFRVGEIADDLLDWLGQPSDEGGDSEDLVALGELRILHEVDHFDFVPSQEMRLADLLQIRQGKDRFRRLSRDVQP